MTSLLFLTSSGTSASSRGPVARLLFRPEPSAERRTINKQIRESTFEYLEKRVFLTSPAS